MLSNRKQQIQNMTQVIKTSKWVIAMLAFLCISNSSFAQSKTSSTAFEMSNEDLKEFVGEYNSSDPGAFNITISMIGDEKLMAQPTSKSEPNTLLVATKMDHFDLNRTPLKIHFNRDDKGKIESLTFSQGNTKFTAKRVK